MKNEELARQLMSTFLDELDEHVETISRELLSQEKPLAQQRLEESWSKLSRSVHTVKGASAIVDVDLVRDACHALEDVFEPYKSENRPMPQELTSLALKAVDAMEDAGKHMRADEGLDDSLLTDLLPELKRIAEEHSSPSAFKNSQEEEADPINEETVSSDVERASNKLETESHGEETESHGEETESHGVETESHGVETESHDEDSETDFEVSPAPPSAPPPTIDPNLLPIFLDELDDHVDTLADNILALENEDNSEQRSLLLNGLFRAAHSIKGAARSVRIDIVQAVSHRLEDLLSELRDGKIELNSEIVSRVLASSDAIKEVGLKLRRGENLDDGAIHEIEVKLDELLGSSDSAERTSDQPHNASPQQSPVPDPSPDVGEPQPADPSQIRPEEPPSTKATETPKQKPAPAIATTVASGSAASIRVAAQKLDALLAHSGELLVARERFALRSKTAMELRDLAADLRSQSSDTRSSSSTPAEALKTIATKLDALSTGMEADQRLLSQTCSLLDDEIYHVRMLPFADACGGLERAVRDIAMSTGKKVSLHLDGSHVEVDRSVLEGLKDPLLHLVRNAVDHGIETPEQRQISGKSAEATITVSASLHGGQVEVVVADDGAGFDLKRICTLAAKRGIEVPEDPREQARLVFAPGFSTAKMITDISGRGVGLDVVQTQVESLHGAVDVTFVKGQGTRFSLLVPLTLTTIRSMLVSVSGQVYAIPTTSIERLVRFSAADIRSNVGRDTLLLREAPTPLVPLAAPLGLKSPVLLAAGAKKGLALILAAGDQRVALTVDEVLSEQEVLVKNLGSRIRRLRHFSGCTLLPNGQIALVTNSANLVRTALSSHSPATAISAKQREIHERKKLLLVDDSITTRALLNNILEVAGYDVVAVADGQQAWDSIQDESFDAVVSDIDMPRMNGFELTMKLRAKPETEEIPIVLITARGSDDDKVQGVHAGANAYIVKGNFDQQNLLDTLAQLV